jgi:hypothetical protein
MNNESTSGIAMRNSNRQTTVALYAFLMALTVLVALAGATEPNQAADVDKVQFERWQKYYRSVAAEYEMEQEKEPPIRLKLQPAPVLSYANPAGGGRSHAAMFVWTRDGRPEIVGAIWSRQSGDNRSVVHEMHSLSLEPLTATRQGKVFWKPRGPGIESFPIPDAPEPATTAPLRLTQMRGLAREFSAATIRGTAERQLQFRPQPVYRFDKPTADRDGAVFVGFEDWDPELLMLIEIRATADGPRWHAGFARFTNLPVSARHKDVRVWSFEESPAEGPFGGFDKRFNAVHGVNVLPAIREE